jgi:hypothetical protein
MMLSLLDPRIWLALAIAIALSFGAGFWKGNAHGESTVRAEWQSATAAANQEARRLEQARQRRADEAAKLAAAREAGIRNSAASARRESAGLRDDLSAARDYATKSRDAAERTATLATDLLGRCEARYLGVAEDAQRADSYARELIDAWPQ